MCIFHYENDKNGQNNGFYSEDYIQNLQLAILKNPENKISTFGMALVSGGFDKIIKVWDFNFVNDGSFVKVAVKELVGHSGWITQVISLEDERNVLSGDDSGEIIIWDIQKSVQVDYIYINTSINFIYFFLF